MFCWIELIFENVFFSGVGSGDPLFCANLLVGLKQGCILNLVEFGCVGAEKMGVELSWVWQLLSNVIK